MATLEITKEKLVEIVANAILDETGNAQKPNFSNRHFINTLIVFQNALMDKMYDNQDYDGMGMEDRLKMVETCGNELRKLIHTFTGLDTHKIEDFL
jgi:hypothetical protein